MKKVWDYKLCPSLAQLKDQLNAVEQEKGKIVNVLPGWNGIVIVYYIESKSDSLCECGCGDPVEKEGNRFIRGHHLRTAS